MMKFVYGLNVGGIGKRKFKDELQIWGLNNWVNGGFIYGEELEGKIGFVQGMLSLKIFLDDRQEVTAGGRLYLQFKGEVRIVGLIWVVGSVWVVFKVMGLVGYRSACGQSRGSLDELWGYRYLVFVEEDGVGFSFYG